MEDEEIIPILKQSDIGSRLNQQELQEFISISTKRYFKTGDYLFREDEIAPCVFTLIKGRIKVVTHLKQGKEIIQGFINPPQMLGTLAAFSGRPSINSAIAVTESMALCVRLADHENFIHKNSEISALFYKELVKMIRQTFHRLTDAFSLPVTQRIAKMLLISAERQGTQLDFSREEIASIVGTSVETVIRITNQMKAERVIDSSTRRIIIINHELLKLISDGSKTLKYYR